MSFGIPVRNGLGLGLTPSTALSTLRVGGRPAMFLNFIGTTSLDSRVTFTRSSTATFVGSNGLIQSAAIDAPRFDYDPVTLAAKGLLIEEQRTNLVLYSEQFDITWNNNNVIINPNTTLSPSGVNTADAISENATLNTHSVTQAVTTVLNTSYAVTVYAKNNGRRYITLATGAANGVLATFDLQTGIISGAATIFGAGWTNPSAIIAPAGNGWYRCVLIGTDTVGASRTFTYSLNNVATNPALGSGNVYTGDGTSGVFFWGAQIEAGAFATSYIPTVASQVTRNTDVATMTGTNFSSWYNQNAGTMLCNFILEGQTVGGAVANVWVVNNSGSTANAITLREGTIITGADVTMLTGGVVQVDSNSIATPVNTILKSAFAWSTTSSNLTANGVSLGDGGAITPPSVNQLVLTGSNKWLQQIAYYNTRLTNAQLQALTT